MTTLQQAIIAIASATVPSLRTAHSNIEKVAANKDEFLSRAQEATQIWVKNSVALANQLCNHPIMNSPAEAAQSTEARTLVVKQPTILKDESSAATPAAKKIAFGKK